MSGRNEQFLCVLAAVVLALPAAAWLRFVGPLRASLREDSQRIGQMQESVASYTAAEVRPPSETERAQRESLRQTHEEIARILGRAPSVSEIYHQIEQAAVRSGVSVARIEHNKSVSRADFDGPLKRDGITAESRIYRVEVEGSVSDLPTFVRALGECEEFVVLRDVRVQFSKNRGSGDHVTATVVLESIAATTRAAKGGGS